MKIKKGTLVRIYFVGGTTVEGNCHKQSKKSITLKSDNGNILFIPNMKHVTMVHLIVSLPAQKPAQTTFIQKVEPLINEQHEDIEYDDLPPSSELMDRASKLKDLRMREAKEDLVSISDKFKTSFNETYSVI